MDVDYPKLGMGSGEHTVEDAFGGGEVSCFGADITQIVDLVAAACPADMYGDSFVGFVCGNDFKVGLWPLGMSLTLMKCMVLVSGMSCQPPLALMASQSATSELLRSMEKSTRVLVLG